jgi:ligand-binding sensor domain-containing protein
VNGELNLFLFGTLGSIRRAPMRFFLAGGLIHLFYAAAYGILPLPLAAVADSDKPLTEYTHTVWTHKEGLPSAFIYSLAQTEDGYLWLATTDGLVRFDGVRFSMIEQLQ